MKVNVASFQSNPTDRDVTPHPRLVTEHRPGLFFFSSSLGESLGSPKFSPVHREWLCVASLFIDSR